ADSRMYRLMGYIVLTGTFVWQMAMVAHQKFILKLRSSFLLILVILAFVSQLIFYWFNADSKDPLIYPIGYLIATTTYLLLLSVSHISTGSLRINFLFKKKDKQVAT
ncbi:MAG: hypothetical protein M3R50_01585, partial [Bacteroidota bacterium]|nr:hypothetical protein [Bacteroidota bacterium]